MKLTPLHDWAILRPSEAEAKTAGGLYIPDAAREKPLRGIVEAIGPGAYEPKKYGEKKPEKERKFIPATIKPGDHVLYDRYAGQTIEVSGEERVLVRERDILGIVLEKPASVPMQKEQGPIVSAAASPGVSPPAAATVPKKEAAATKPVPAKKPAGKAPAKAKKAAAKKTRKKK